ncbi:MAG: cobalamin biosynthesis protein CobD [Candidatus Atelocyanobacterium thalassa]
MDTDFSIIILIIATIIDYLISDPSKYLHPVQVMGWLIFKASNLIFKFCNGKFVCRCAGSILCLLLVLASGFFGWTVSLIKYHFFPLIGITIESILLASCFAGRSLRLAAIDVIIPLNTNKIDLARIKLSQYVGRDTRNLSKKDIWRTMLETISENSIDGVIAPLFYAIIGALLPYTSSLTLALAYKASSTLDSTIGYKKEPFTDIGWFSANLEDILTWIPCRLGVLTLAILSGRPYYVLSICNRDGDKDLSPNSGWSESIYAAILGVQLGGKNIYDGTIKKKPLLGEPIKSITFTTIEKALVLTRVCSLLWLGLGIILIYIKNTR